MQTSPCVSSLHNHHVSAFAVFAAILHSSFNIVQRILDVMLSLVRAIPFNEISCSRGSGALAAAQRRHAKREHIAVHMRSMQITRSYTKEGNPKGVLSGHVIQNASVCHPPAIV